MAPEDKASHAYNNKKTERTKHFWKDGGVYLTLLILFVIKTIQID